MLALSHMPVARLNVLTIAVQPYKLYKAFGLRLHVPVSPQDAQGMIQQLPMP